MQNASFEPSLKLPNTTNLFRFLAYSNIYIAISAASLAFFSMIFFNLETYKIETISFVFFGTLFTYTFQRKVDLLYSSNEILTKRDDWMKQKSSLVNFLIFFSLAACLILFYILPKQTFLLIAPLLILSVLYILRLRWFNSFKSLRMIPYLSLIHI